VARLGGEKIFSHTMNIIDGLVYEAVMLKGCRAGVPLDEAMKGVTLFQDMYVPVPDLAAAIEWGEAQDGADYDYFGAAGIPLLMSEDWNDESSWWCSEHNFRQIWKGGTLMLDPNVRRRVTPAHLRMCNYRKSPIVNLRKAKDFYSAIRVQIP
jgi:hypothetical protein